MSKEINNSIYRQKVLTDLISQLHDGVDFDTVKEQFAEIFDGVSSEEIAQAEQALINNGLPVEEVQRLCDVHAAVFKGSIADIHKTTEPSEIPGHPVNILVLENKAIKKVLNQIMLHYQDSELLAKELQKLTALDLHYTKKETLIFPYLEKYGITGPTKVMWGVDNEIKSDLKAMIKANTNGEAIAYEWIEHLTSRIEEMIFKEESIMVPMLIDNLNEDEWRALANDNHELGFALIQYVPKWSPLTKTEASLESEMTQGEIQLGSGHLKIEELIGMLNTLPIDITFVDKDNNVKYFSQGSERVFARANSIIGRKVINCHPPASVHIVENIIEDLRSGRKDHEDFWINMKDKFVFIRYFAVRDENKEFLGVLEVTQDIKPIQALTGEKRLVED
ncbi:MAG: DUF438 domain-containing protein [Erysipelotrichaceae bacterium]|nr:DUF438 domain-containing protein [Erysipelotrichaceae bacterium]